MKSKISRKDFEALRARAFALESEANFAIGSDANQCLFHFDLCIDPGYASLAFQAEGEDMIGAVYALGKLAALGKRERKIADALLADLRKMISKKRSEK